jgi:alkanesulfonate monooxygenase SsuD/methylene tetrahydromethanopterin reductase-like flavin-dependent oxidoreductase (luciferase family)
VEFSLLNGVRNHPDTPAPLPDLYADYLSDALLAEELGFGRSWYGEHHFRPCQWTGSPMLVAAAVAARTERLRVGTAVTLLPFHHPVRVAEDAAVTDILSGGRFDLGVGPGSQYEEFVSFGIDPSQMNKRSWESIDWIRRAFSEPGEFSHKGQFYDIPAMTFTTKPVQDPLPVWWGGMGPRNQARAAERGFNFIGPFNPGYDDRLREAGRDPGDHEIAAMVMVCVADTTEKAWDVAGPGLEYVVNFYETRRDLEGNPAPPEKRVTADLIREGRAGFWRAFVGTPDEVAAGLRPLAEGRMGRVTELALQLRHPGMSTADTHRSMRLFAEHVAPALAA